MIGEGDELLRWDEADLGAGDDADGAIGACNPVEEVGVLIWGCDDSLPGAEDDFIFETSFMEETVGSRTTLSCPTLNPSTNRDAGKFHDDRGDEIVLECCLDKRIHRNVGLYDDRSLLRVDLDDAVETADVDGTARIELLFAC